MKVLVTGSNGFIGKNLIAELRTKEEVEVMEYNRNTGSDLLNEYCQKADFVFHLAGVNRPETDAEFIEGNYEFTKELLQLLKDHQNTCPVMISSSTQAANDNPYGKSKNAGEGAVFAHSNDTGARSLVYRFQNVFGKWSKPNYNTVIATFCYNIARDKAIHINN